MKNVGRTKKDGTPIKREIDAINAIEDGLVDITIGGLIEYNSEKIVTMSEVYVNKINVGLQVTAACDNMFFY